MKEKEEKKNLGELKLISLILEVEKNKIFIL